MGPQLICRGTQDSVGELGNRSGMARVSQTNKAAAGTMWKKRASTYGLPPCAVALPTYRVDTVALWHTVDAAVASL